MNMTEVQTLDLALNHQMHSCTHQWVSCSISVIRLYYDDVIISLTTHHAKNKEVARLSTVYLLTQDKNLCIVFS